MYTFLDNMFKVLKVAGKRPKNGFGDLIKKM